MKKHTPHPWKIVPCSNPHEAFAIEADGKSICWVANTYDEKRDREVVTAEDRANARLIVNAPKMYALLEVLHANAAEQPEWIRKRIASVIGKVK